MEDEKRIKRVGLEMNLLMSISMSLCMSLTGMLSAGQFTIPGFIENFIISLIISFMIGLFVSIPKLNVAVERLLHLKRGALAARTIEALLADLIYTPLMSILMITLGWFNARVHGAEPPYLLMLLKGLGLSLLMGFFLIFLFMPLFLKLVLKHNGFPVDMEKPSDEPGDDEI